APTAPVGRATYAYFLLLFGAFDPEFADGGGARRRRPAGPLLEHVALRRQLHVLVLRRLLSARPPHTSPPPPPPPPHRRRDRTNRRHAVPYAPRHIPTVSGIGTARAVRRGAV